MPIQGPRPEPRPGLSARPRSPSCEAGLGRSSGIGTNAPNLRGTMPRAPGQDAPPHHAASRSSPTANPLVAAKAAVTVGQGDLRHARCPRVALGGELAAGVKRVFVGAGVVLDLGQLAAGIIRICDDVDAEPPDGFIQVSVLTRLSGRTRS